jgi:hypothetical protein
LEALPEIEGQGFVELLDGVRYSGVPFEGKEIAVRLQREEVSTFTSAWVML